MSFSSNLLKEKLAARQRKNPHYSLRAFSRDLGLHPGTLSAILQAKRRLPLEKATSVAQSLELTPKQRMRFIEDLELRSRSASRVLQSKSSDALELEETHFHVISEWEHYAVLNLLNTKGFRSDSSWIARRLGITKLRAEDVVARLLSIGLVETTSSGSLRRTSTKLKTAEDVASLALRRAHADELDLAKSRMETTEVESRDFSSITMAIDPGRLPAAKLAIRRFRREMEALLEAGSQTEVYQLCIQLFPLTQSVAQSEIQVVTEK